MDSTTSLPTMAPPPGAPPAQTHRYSTHEWEMQKPTIKRLYIEEQQTLSDVMSIMRQEFGFIASRKQFKDRITKWGLDVKNMRGSSILAMGRARVRRKRYEAKDSAFRVNKKPVDEQKINRYLKRKGISEDFLLSMPSPVNPPSPAFSVYTPSPPTPDPSASSPDAAKSPPLIPAALRRSVATSSNRGSVELGWAQQTDTPFPAQSSVSIGMDISPPGMKQYLILSNNLLNLAPEAGFSIFDAPSSTPCPTAEADISMQDLFFHTMAPTSPLPPLPDIQFNHLPILDTSNPPYTQELCRSRFEEDTTINSLSSLVEDTNMMMPNTTMSISFSGQSPRLIDLRFPGLDLNAWSWGAGILPMSMPTPVSSTSPMVDSQFLPQMEMAHDSVLDDDAEEIIRAPQILDAEMWIPMSQHISCSSTAPPTLAKDTPVDKINRQLEVRDKSFGIFTLRFDKQTSGILSVQDGPTEYLCTTLVRPLLRDLETMEKDLETLERDFHSPSHAATPFDNLQEKPTLRITESEHLRRCITSLATDSENMQAAIVLARTLVLAFSESWDQHISAEIKHLTAATLLINQALYSYKESAKGDVFPQFRFMCNTWLYIEIITQLILVDDDYSTGFETYLASIITQFSIIIAEINPLMICTSTLFPIIGRVAILCRKARKAESNSIAIISQATELKEAIIQWSLPSFIEQFEYPSSKISQALRTAEVYRYTALLYLHQAVPEIAP